MQSAKQAFERAKCQWQNVPAWAGLLLSVLTIAAVAFMTWHWHSGLRRSTASEYLLDGERFDKSQLRPIVQALAKRNLTDYVIDQQRIRVPRGSVPLYHAALADADALPGEFRSHTNDALLESRVFESEQARQQRLQHARELDLALAIRAMEGVDDAMVQLDEIESRGYQSQRIVTASVSIRPSNGHALDRGQIRAISRQVAAANAGMRPDDVVVTDLGSGISYAGGEANDAVGPVAEEYLRVKRSVERSWQQKMVQVLGFIPGARIVVDAKLAADAREAELHPLPSAEPQRLAVSVGVPESYLRDVWRLRRADGKHSPSSGPAAAELRTLRDEMESQIRDAIMGLVPDSIDMASAVTVTLFHDLTNASRDDAQNRWAASTWREMFTSHRWAWLAVITGGLLVGGVTWLSRRDRSPAEPQPTIPLSSHVAESAYGRSDETADGIELDEGTLRATLTELVRHDPDGAAEILHRWMDKAG